MATIANRVGSQYGLANARSENRVKKLSRRKLEYYPGTEELSLALAFT